MSQGVINYLQISYVLQRSLPVVESPPEKSQGKFYSEWICLQFIEMHSTMRKQEQTNNIIRNFNPKRAWVNTMHRILFNK
jgi:hypothetical protein